MGQRSHENVEQDGKVHYKTDQDWAQPGIYQERKKILQASLFYGAPVYPLYIYLQLYTSLWMGVRFFQIQARVAVERRALRWFVFF